MTEFEQFINSYWQYYRELEDEFLATRKYVDFYAENNDTFSVEYLKLFQAVCGEIDMLGKEMAMGRNPSFKPADSKNNILKWWYEIQEEYLFYDDIGSKSNPQILKDTEVSFLYGGIKKPWEDFTVETYRDTKGSLRYRCKDGCNNPSWWKDYNLVKHSRTLAIKDDPNKINYFKANMGNTLSAFAALYTLEKAYMAVIGTRREREAFADGSRLFEKRGNITTEDIEAIINS